MAYNASLQAEWDWQNAVELAEERAAAIADENARREERAKAEARERQLLQQAEAKEREFLKEAEAEKRELLIQSARALKKSGVPNVVIAESLGLPIGVVEKL